MDIDISLFHIPTQLAERGDQVNLVNLVKKDPEVLGEKDCSGASPLHHAARGGHISLIQFISSVVNSQELNSCDEQGNVPLHWAVEKNRVESCKALLDLGADPNVLNTVLLSPLHMAINLQHNNLVAVRGVTDCNLQGDLENTPVILACSSNNCEALELLLKHGGKLCQQNKLGHFPIHAAAFAGARKSMEVILKAGEKLGHETANHINYLDKSKSSPLHLAVRGGNVETICLCIASGAKIDQQQNDRSTPLHLACTQGATEVVRVMLTSVERVEDVINLTDGAHQTPLHKATTFDHTELVEYLISLGADLNSVDCKENTPLLLATSCGAWKSVALLLSKGAKVNVKDRRGCNFLHLAILQPKGLKNLPEDVLQVVYVKELLGSEDDEGCTPLHYACRLGVHDSVKNMLGLSGDIGLSYKSKDKKSALHFAAQYGRINTCKRLLESITDSRLLNEGDERGLTPLHLASRAGHAKVVRLLLHKGALLHCDYKGLTCLHHAAAEGYTQTMEVLLSASVKLLDKTDEDGNTALHIAAKAGHTAAVKLLLNRGAEFVLNKSNTSFLHEAIQNGRKEVVIAVIDSERCIKYEFRWLQAPLHLTKLANDSMKIKPLACLNFMVEYNRLDLLNHPVCRKYLAMKWIAYGSKAHVLNMFMFLLGLLPLTYVVVKMRPSMNTTETGESKVVMVPVSFLEVCTTYISVLIKEVLQISQQRWNYFKDQTNMMDWSVAILSLLFILPLILNVEGSLHWQAGALAVLSSWSGFLLYIQRFDGIGIYVVMFGEIMKTLMRIVLLFVYMLFAFSLAFYALMLNHREFSSVPLSLIQTFVMMVGELNYQNNILDALFTNRLPFSYLTYFIFIQFVLWIPILLVNLMIGLAVGDIAEVQRNASLKRIAMQVELHTALEDKLPYWFMKRVDKAFVTVYPNRKCSGVSQTLEPAPCVYDDSNEILKQKKMSDTLEKQHTLLKLIVQKMDITSEADESDGPETKAHMWPNLSQVKPRRHPTSRWVPLMKAIGAPPK
uniref:Ion transport domain-containing protein n=1 Tax=Gouania willdenowi TaxID=441366 RepID=A0A8C5HY13_GOUWI